MKRLILVMVLVAGYFTVPLRAQMKLELDHLAAKAKESVDVSLDASMLRFAGTFLSSQKSNEAKAKELISGLKGIHVRAFEFEKEGAYTPADLQAIRTQLQGPGWSRIVHAVEGGGREGAEVYVRTDGNRPSGLAVLAYEAKEQTGVAIDGPIDLERLAELAGHFGIPEIDLGVAKKKQH